MPRATSTTPVFLHSQQAYRAPHYLTFEIGIAPEGRVQPLEPSTHHVDFSTGSAENTSYDTTGGVIIGNDYHDRSEGF